MPNIFICSTALRSPWPTLLARLRARRSPRAGQHRSAVAKLWHGLRRFRRRQLESVNSEGLLIAAGQNLKRLLASSGWGRRHAPCGSLVALPRELWRIAVVSG